MAEKIFDAQINYGWGRTFKMSGKAPAISDRIFDTKADMLDYVNNINESAIEGLLLTVVADTKENNGAYFVKQVKDETKNGIVAKIPSTEYSSFVLYSDQEGSSKSTKIQIGQDEIPVIQSKYYEDSGSTKLDPIGTSKALITENVLYEVLDQYGLDHPDRISNVEYENNKILFDHSGENDLTIPVVGKVIGTSVSELSFVGYTQKDNLVSVDALMSSLSVVDTTAIASAAIDSLF